MSPHNLPSQKEAIARTLALYPKRPFAVADIGSQSAWLKGASHDARNLYVSGPMGLASSVAMGVAQSRLNDEVLAICGDGALAMNLSSLVTLQGARLANLTLLLLDNGVYEYTGSLPTPTRQLNWLALGRAVFGEESCFRLEDLTASTWSSLKRPAMIVAEIAASAEATPALGMTPSQIREAFLIAAGTT